jgi:hypothetical protein
LSSDDSTSPEFANRDVFGALTISLAGGDGFQVSIAPDTDHQTPEQSQAARGESCPTQITAAIADETW